MSRRLTQRQHRFIEEFLVDGNATQAARRAGYSHRTARQIASENLSKPVIRAKIDALLERRSILLKGQVDAVVASMTRMLRADIATLFDEEGLPLPVAKMPIEFRQGLLVSMRVHRVTKRDQTQVVRFSLRFADRLGIVKALGNRLGAWATVNTSKSAGGPGLGEPGRPRTGARGGEE